MKELVKVLRLPITLGPVKSRPAGRGGPISGDATAAIMPSDSAPDDRPKPLLIGAAKIQALAREASAAGGGQFDPSRKNGSRAIGSPHSI